MALPQPTVTFSLSQDKALVLFEFPARFNELDAQPCIEDQAEQRALWDLECMLERQLPAVLDPRYRQLLASARARVRDV